MEIVHKKMKNKIFMIQSICKNTESELGNDKFKNKWSIAWKGQEA